MSKFDKTLLWILVICIGSIFKVNWIIWVIATVVWLKFMKCEHEED